MLHYLKRAGVTVLSVIALSCQASAYYPHCESIARGLQNKLQRANPAVKMGVVVQSQSNGRIYYSKNANRFFMPASVQKLFTVTAALLDLSPHYQFATRVYTTGVIANGALNGNLIFQFNGDPSFTQTNLNDLIKQLKTHGIHAIDGHIVIDDTAYSHVPYPAGWTWDDLIYDYAAPLNTIIINRNRFGIAFQPARRPGEKPIVIPRLPPGTATFYNEAITTQYPKYSCPLTIFSNAHNQYLVRGCIAIKQGIQRRAFAIRNVEMFTQGLVRQLMEKHDIHFHGNFITEKTPHDAQLLEIHDSKPLSHLIIHLLKKSDNLYADALLKKIGEKNSGMPGSWDNGLAALKPILARYTGLNPHILHLDDGAGLSRYNLITPESISQLLFFIQHNPMLQATLIPALPIAGVDGTLEGRMPMLARGKRLRAKTGSLDGVSTLAGFIQTTHHGLLSFVIMMNNLSKNRAPYIVLENHVGEFLANARSCG